MKQETKDKMTIALMSATVLSFLGTILILMCCSGCITTTRDGYRAVQVFSADAQFVEADIWLKWPWRGDPLAWLARQMTTNTVTP